MRLEWGKKRVLFKGAQTSSNELASVSSSLLAKPGTGGSLRQGSVSDLGEALLAFLHFYGEEFNYSATSIHFTSKTVEYRSKEWGVHPYEFSLNDPAGPFIDLGNKAYAIKHIQATFKDAYGKLAGLIRGGAGASEREKARVKGMLGCVIGGDFGHFVQKRKGMVRRWEGRGVVRAGTGPQWKT